MLDRKKKFWQKSDTVKLIVLVVLVSLFIGLLVYVARADDRQYTDSSRTDLPSSFELAPDDALDVPQHTRSTDYVYFYPYSAAAQNAAGFGSYAESSIYVTLNSRTNAESIYRWYWYASYSNPNLYKLGLFTSSYPNFDQRYQMNGYATYTYIPDYSYPTNWSDSNCYLATGVGAMYSTARLFKCEYYNGSTYTTLSPYAVYYSQNGTTWILCNSTTPFTSLFGDTSFVFVYNISSSVQAYSVTLNSNGGTYSGLTTYTLAYSTTTNLSNYIPVREGYTFEGWYTAADGGYRVYSVDSTESGHTLYAHWSGGGTSSFTVRISTGRDGYTIDNNDYKDFPFVNVSSVFLTYEYMNGLGTYKHGNDVIVPSYYSFDPDGLSIVDDGFAIAADTVIYFQYNPGANVVPSDPSITQMAGLIGAVANVPIAWLGVLNFDIFGVNILNLITGLLTVAIVCWLVITIIKHIRR